MKALILALALLASPAAANDLNLGSCATRDDALLPWAGGVYRAWVCSEGHVVLEHLAGPKHPLADQVKPRPPTGPKGPTPVEPDPFGPGPKLEI